MLFAEMAITVAPIVARRMQIAQRRLARAGAG
jgi:hypothetical protein